MHLWCVFPSSHEKSFNVQDHTRTTYVVRVKPEDKFYHPIIMASIEPKINFFMLNGGNGIRKEVCTVSRFLFMFPWHFINGIFIIYIVDQSICFEQLKYGIMCVCVPWQVKFWLRLFARFLRHVWHQKHENFVVLVLVTWQYLVFKYSLFVYWAYGKDISLSADTYM